MIGESVAILFVLAVMSVMSLRTGRKTMYKLTMPFFCVPLAFLIGEALSFTWRSTLTLPLQTQRVIAVMLGALAGVAIAFIVAGIVAQSEKNAKRIYIPFALVFIAAMAVTYCIRLMR